MFSKEKKNLKVQENFQSMWNKDISYLFGEINQNEE